MEQPFDNSRSPLPTTSPTDAGMSLSQSTFLFTYVMVWAALLCSTIFVGLRLLSNDRHNRLRKLLADGDPTPPVFPASSPQPPPLPPRPLQPPLTFGIEFEFAAAILLRGPDPEPEHPQPLFRPPMENMSDGGQSALWRGMKRVLIGAGLPAKVQREMPNFDSSDSTGSEVDITIADLDLVGETNQDYDHHWSIFWDGSVSGPRYTPYTWLATEISSPPYLYIPAALDAVRLFCNKITAGFRINVNSSCGLHVHVGNGTAGFPFRVIQNIMALLWVFEPQLDQLHPQRYAPADEQSGHYYSSLRRGSVLCYGGWVKGVISSNAYDHDPDDRKAMMPTVMEGLQAILSTTEVNSLCSLLSPNLHQGKPAYMISNLMDPGDAFKRTIEFRQHEGTLNGERAVEWIKTVVELVHFARDVDSATLVNFLTAHARDEDRLGRTKVMDIIELFDAIGMKDRARAWEVIFPIGARRKPSRYYGSGWGGDWKERGLRVQRIREAAREELNFKEDEEQDTYWRSGQAWEDWVASSAAHKPWNNGYSPELLPIGDGLGPRDSGSDQGDDDGDWLPLTSRSASWESGDDVELPIAWSSGTSWIAANSREDLPLEKSEILPSWV